MKSKYPIEFQKLKKVLNQKQILSKNKISISKYQNNNVNVIKFYKNISKLTEFNE